MEDGHTDHHHKPKSRAQEISGKEVYTDLDQRGRIIETYAPSVMQSVMHRKQNQ